MASSSRRVSSSWIGGTPSSLLDDAANLPGAELELLRDRFEPRLLVEVPFLETLNDQLRDALGIVHRRAPRRQFRTAPQARPEAGLLGFLRRVEEAAVGLLWRLRRTDRPAVDAGRRDADEEHAVESRIAGGQGVVEPAAGPGPWPHHTRAGRRRIQPFSDMAFVLRADVRKRRARVGGTSLYSDATRMESVRARLTLTQNGARNGQADQTRSDMSTRRCTLPSGRLTLVATDEGLAAILWENDRPRRVRLNIEAEDHRPSRARRGRAPARGILCRTADEVRADAGPCRNGLPAQGVERAADDPVRRDAIVRTDRDGRSGTLLPCAPSVRQTAEIPCRSSRRAIGSSGRRASSRGSPAGSTPRRSCWRWKE